MTALWAEALPVKMQKEFRFKLSGGRLLVLRKGEAWEDAFMDSLLTTLVNKDLSGFERVQGSTGSRLWRASCSGQSYFIKFFNPRGFRDRLLWRKSRSHRAMLAECMLAEKGFSRPALVAQGDIVSAFRVLDNFIITRWVEGSFNTYAYMRTFFASPLSAEKIREKRLFIKYFGSLIGKMHQKGVFHGDLRPGNILFRPQDGRDPETCFIDNERTMLFEKGIPSRLRRKNLIQLNMIVMPPVTFTDRIRFFDAYLSENPGLIPERREWIRNIFVKTKKRLRKKIPGVWGD